MDCGWRGADDVPRGMGRIGEKRHEGSKKIKQNKSSTNTEKWTETLAAWMVG